MKLKHLILILICSYLHVSAEPERYEMPVEASRRLGCTAVSHAMQEVGNIEKLSNNRDEWIQKYLRSVGIKAPAPYCAAGLYWCYDMASKAVGVENPLLKTGVATDQYNHYKKNGSKTEYKAKVSDMLVWQKYRSWAGHIEIVVEVLNKGWVRTIGFNTGNRNARLGDGVHEKLRDLYDPLGSLYVKGLIGNRYADQ